MRDKLPMQELELKMQGGGLCARGCNHGILRYMHVHTTSYRSCQAHKLSAAKALSFMILDILEYSITALLISYTVFSCY